jgi:uncharacterized protein YaiI (UPF0178 family)
LLVSSDIGQVYELEKIKHRVNVRECSAKERTIGKVARHAAGKRILNPHRSFEWGKYIHIPVGL